MQIEPQPLSSPGAVPEPITPPEKKLIAPVWHTILIVVLILLNSFGGSQITRTSSAASIPGRYALYVGTFVVQLIFFLLIWFGISRRGVKMRELIGGRWRSPEDFLIDVGIAFGFWFVSSVLRVAIMVALRIVDLHHPDVFAKEMKHAVAPLMPQNLPEIVVFLCLTIAAGFFEEIIFRGYLQRQFGALTRNIWIGVVASAILFGAAHGYQGTKLMVVIGIYGAMFGVLAALRKSLRPGMIAHAGQDAFSGITYFLATKSGLL